MEHRYGRHGPRAWLRLRQRRYSRPSVLPAPVAPPPTVVRVFVPASAERIIFIVMSNDPHPSGEWQAPETQVVVSGQQYPSTPDSPQITDQLTSQFVDGSAARRSLPSAEETIKRLKQIAYLAGKKRANEEVEVGDPDNLPSQQQLQREANTFASRVLMDQLSQGTISVKGDIDTLIREVADICLQTYYKEIEVFEIEGTIPDERTRDIRQVAWADKASHQAQNKSLSPEYVRYLGTARAMRDLGIDTELSLEDLDEIHAYVDVYRKYYQEPVRESKEVGRLPRPRGF